jgi:hypothetical protein
VAFILCHALSQSVRYYRKLWSIIRSGGIVNQSKRGYTASVLKGKIQGSRVKDRRRTHKSSDELSIPSAHSAIFLKAFEIREGLPALSFRLVDRMMIPV